MSKQFKEYKKIDWGTQKKFTVKFQGEVLFTAGSADQAIHSVAYGLLWGNITPKNVVIISVTEEGEAQ